MHRTVLTVIGVLITTPVAAQVRNNRDQDVSVIDDQVPQSSVPSTSGRGQAPATLTLGNGEVGQRQTRADAAPNIQPMGRIRNRVANRIQSRIHNRIDRDYDPANVNQPFQTAEDQARTTPR